MLTVCASSIILCSCIDMVVSGVGCPSASMKILVNICSVCLNGSPTIHEWDVHDVSHDGEGIEPSSTPCLICCSVNSVSLRFLPLILVRWRRRHVALSLSMWLWERKNCTLRLPLIYSVDLDLACAWDGPGVWFGPTYGLHSLLVVSSTSTWIVSGVYAVYRVALILLEVAPE